MRGLLAAGRSARLPEGHRDYRFCRGLQVRPHPPRRLVSGQFSIIRDSPDPANMIYMSVGELLDAESRRSDSTLSQPIRQEGEEMPIPSNDNSRRWNYAFLCFVLILAASGYTGRTLAQESAPSGKIYVVT